MKISELPKAAAVNDTDVIPLVQSGETKQASRKDFVGVVPNDLKLSDRLLQLTANGEASGGGITLPDFGKFELWNDITLAEDVKTITMSKTDDGRPLNIKEMFLYFNGKFNMDSAALLFYGRGNIYQLWTNFKASNDILTAFWVYSKKVGDGAFFSIYPATQITGNVLENGNLQGLSAANKELKSDFSHHNTIKKAESFSFGGYEKDFRMLAGSRVFIWGVMDND